MKTTIDGAGRIVIPKGIRDSVGLTGGSEVEIREVDGLIEISPVATDFRIVIRGGVPVAVTDRPMPPLTDEMIRDAIDKSRDERLRRVTEEMKNARS